MAIKPAKTKRNWIRNTASSMKFIATDIVSEVMPNLSGTLRTTSSAFSEGRAKINRAAVARQNKELERLPLGSKVKKLFRDAEDDIKSGNFAQGTARRELLSYSSEIDADDFLNPSDENGSASYDPSSSVKAITNVGTMVANGNAATISSIQSMTSTLASATVKSNRALSANLQNISIAHTNALNSGFKEMVREMQINNSYQAAILQFMNQNISPTNQNILQALPQIGEAIDKLSQKIDKLGGAQASSASQTKAMDKIFNEGFGMDFNSYAKHVKGNFGESEVGQMFAMIKMMTQGASLAEVPLRIAPIAAKFGMKAAIGRQNRETMKNLDINTNKMLKHMLYALGDYKNDSDTMGGQVLQFLANVLGVKRPELNRKFNLGNGRKEEVMGWNGIAQRTLVEVIPGYLASMEAALTRGPRKHYNYDTGTFSSEKDIFKDLTERMTKEIATANSDAIDRVLNVAANRGMNDKQVSQLVDALNELFNDRLSNGTGYDKTYRNKAARTLQSTGFTVEEQTSIIREMEEGLLKATDAINTLNESISSDNWNSAHYRSIMNGLSENSSKYRQTAETMKFNAFDMSGYVPMINMADPLQGKFDKGIMKWFGPGMKQKQKGMAGILELMLNGTKAFSDQLYTGAAIDSRVGKASTRMTSGHREAILNNRKTLADDFERSIEQMKKGDRQPKDLEALRQRYDKDIQEGIQSGNTENILQSMVLSLHTNFLAPVSEGIFGKHGLIGKFFGDDENSLFNQLKEKLFGKEDGLLTPMVDWFKYKFTGKGYTDKRTGQKYEDTNDSVWGNVKNTYGKIFANTAQYLFGEGYEEDENYKKSMWFFSPEAFQERKDQKEAVKRYWKQQAELRALQAKTGADKDEGTGYSQKDRRWAHIRVGLSNMEKAGCGYTALANALDMKPSEVVSFAKRNGYVSRRGGAKAGLFTEGVKKLGFNGEKIGYGQIRRALSEDKTLIITGKSRDKNSIFSEEGHILSIDAISGNNVRITDPASGDTAFVSLSSIKSMGLANIYAIDSELGHGDSRDNYDWNQVLRWQLQHGQWINGKFHPFGPPFVARRSFNRNQGGGGGLPTGTPALPTGAPTSTPITPTTQNVPITSTQQPTPTGSQQQNQNPAGPSQTVNSSATVTFSGTGQNLNLDMAFNITLAAPEEKNNTLLGTGDMTTISNFLSEAIGHLRKVKDVTDRLDAIKTDTETLRRKLAPTSDEKKSDADALRKRSADILNQIKQGKIQAYSGKKGTNQSRFETNYNAAQAFAVLNTSIENGYVDVEEVYQTLTNNKKNLNPRLVGLMNSLNNYKGEGKNKQNLNKMVIPSIDPAKITSAGIKADVIQLTAQTVVIQAANVNGNTATFAAQSNNDNKDKGNNGEANVSIPETPTMMDAITAIREARNEDSDTPLDEVDTNDGLGVAGILTDEVQRGAEAIRESTESLNTLAFGEQIPTEREAKSKLGKLFQDIKRDSTHYLSGAVGGAVLGTMSAASTGLISSFLLPGGPISGALAGVGLSILSRNKKFMDTVFGQQNEDGTRKDDGLISARFQESFKKALPFAVGGGVLGILKNLVLGSKFSPNLGILGNAVIGSGPIGAAIIGASLGLLKNSEHFNKFLFGEKGPDGIRNGGVIGKFLKGSTDTVKKVGGFITGGIKGLSLGAVLGGTLGHLGILGGALTLGGPVGAAVAGLGLGIASNSKRFQEMLFGTTDVVDGETIKNKDGLLQRFVAGLKVDLLNPLRTHLIQKMEDISIWAAKTISLPLKNLFGPIADSFASIKDMIAETMKEGFERISKGIGDALKTTLGVIASPFKKVALGLGKGLMNSVVFGTKLTGSLMMAPLRLLGITTKSARGRMEESYRKDRNAKFRNNQRGIELKRELEEKNGRFNGAFGGIRRSLSHMLDDIGLGTFDSATDAELRGMYAEQAKAAGQDTGGWFEAGTQFESKFEQYKKDRKARRKLKEANKIAAQWAKEDKNNQSKIWGKDLTQKRYKEIARYLDPAAMGIRNEKDLKDFMYNRSEWEEKFGEFGQGIKIEENPEEVTARENTAEYQNTVVSLLTRFADVVEDFQYSGSDAFSEEARLHNEKVAAKKRAKVEKALKKYGVTNVDLYAAMNYSGLSQEDIMRLDEDTWRGYSNSNEFVEYGSDDIGPDGKKMGGLGAYLANNYQTIFHDEINAGLKPDNYEGFEKWVKAGRKPEEVAKYNKNGYKNNDQTVTQVQQAAASVQAATAGNNTGESKELKPSDILSGKDLKRYNALDKKIKNHEKYGSKITNAERSEWEAFNSRITSASAKINSTNVTETTTTTTDGSGKPATPVDRVVEVLEEVKGFIAGNTEAVTGVKPDENGHINLKEKEQLDLEHEELVAKMNALNAFENSKELMDLQAKLNENEAKRKAIEDREAAESKEAQARGGGKKEEKKDNLPDFEKMNWLQKLGYGITHNKKGKVRGSGLLSGIAGIFNFFKESSLLTKLAIGLGAWVFRDKITDGINFVGTAITQYLPKYLPMIMTTIGSAIGSAANFILTNISNVASFAIQLLPGLLKGAVQGIKILGTDLLQKLGFGKQQVNEYAEGAEGLDLAAGTANGMNLAIDPRTGELYQDENGNYLTLKNQYIDENGKIQKAKGGGRVLKDVGRVAFNSLLDPRTAGRSMRLVGGAVNAATAIPKHLPVVGKSFKLLDAGGNAMRKAGKNMTKNASDIIATKGSRSLLKGSEEAAEALIKKNSLKVAVAGAKKSARESAQIAAETAIERAVRETLENSGKEVSEKAMKKMTKKLAKQTTKEAQEAILKEGSEELLEQGAKGVAKAVGNKASKIAAANARTMVSDTAKAAKGGIFRTAINGLKKAVGHFKNLIDGSMFGKLIEKLSKGLDTALAKLGDTGLGKWVIKAAGKTGEGLSKVLPFVGWGFMAVDAISGAVNAQYLFDVPTDKVDALMRTVSAVFNTILGLGVGPVIDIMFEMIDATTGKNYKKEIASWMYITLMSMAGKKAEAEMKLNQGQTELEIELQNYNDINGTNLTMSEYNEVKRKSTNWLGAITGKKKKFQQYKATAEQLEAAGIYKQSEKSKNVTINNIVNYNTSLKEDTANKVKNSGRETAADETVGNGRGKAVGYGFSQRDSRWAGYPLGNFRDGSVATMADAGCGPTALAMMATNMTGKNVSPIQVAAYAKKKGMITDGGANADLFDSGARAFGLKTSKVPTSAIRAKLANGEKLIVSGRSMAGYGKGNSIYTPAGHIVTMEALTGNNVMVSDPQDGFTKIMSIEDATNEAEYAWSARNAAGFGFGKFIRNRKIVGYGGGHSRGGSGETTSTIISQHTSGSGGSHGGSGGRGSYAEAKGIIITPEENARYENIDALLSTPSSAYYIPGFKAILTDSAFFNDDYYAHPELYLDSLNDVKWYSPSDGVATYFNNARNNTSFLTAGTNKYNQYDYGKISGYNEVYVYDKSKNKYNLEVIRDSGNLIQYAREGLHSKYVIYPYKYTDEQGKTQYLDLLIDRNEFMRAQYSSDAEYLKAYSSIKTTEEKGEWIKKPLKLVDNYLKTGWINKSKIDQTKFYVNHFSGTTDNGMYADDKGELNKFVNLVNTNNPDYFNNLDNYFNPDGRAAFTIGDLIAIDNKDHSFYKNSFLFRYIIDSLKMLLKTNQSKMYQNNKYFDEAIISNIMADKVAEMGEYLNMSANALPKDNEIFSVVNGIPYYSQMNKEWKNFKWHGSTVGKDGSDLVSLAMILSAYNNHDGSHMAITPAYILEMLSKFPSWSDRNGYFTPEFFGKNGVRSLKETFDANNKPLRSQYTTSIANVMGAMKDSKLVMITGRTSKNGDSPFGTEGASNTIVGIYSPDGRVFALNDPNNFENSTVNNSQNLGKYMTNARIISDSMANGLSLGDGSYDGLITNTSIWQQILDSSKDSELGIIAALFSGLGAIFTNAMKSVINGKKYKSIFDVDYDIADKFETGVSTDNVTNEIGNPVAIDGMMQYTPSIKQDTLFKGSNTSGGSYQTVSQKALSMLNNGNLNYSALQNPNGPWNITSSKVNTKSSSSAVDGMTYIQGIPAAHLQSYYNMINKKYTPGSPNGTGGENDEVFDAPIETMEDFVKEFEKIIGKRLGFMYNDSTSTDVDPYDVAELPVADKNSKSAAQLVEYCKQLYQTGVGYVWGASVEIFSAGLKSTLSSRYPDHKNEYETKFKTHKGKIVSDCSGILRGFTQKGLNANNFFKMCSKTGTMSNFPKNVPGLLVFDDDNGTKVHVGISDGKGYIYDCYPYGNMNDFNYRPWNATSRWTHWGYSKYIDYSSSVTSGTGILSGIINKVSSVTKTKAVVAPQTSSIKKGKIIAQNITGNLGFGSGPSSNVAKLTNSLGGRITNTVGLQIDHRTGKLVRHKGTDIAAGYGTPIQSPISGRVVANRHKATGYGNHLVIRDSAGNDHLFAHLAEKSWYGIGDKVDYGDIIGNIGSTGNSTGPHLHYEDKAFDTDLTKNATGGENDVVKIMESMGNSDDVILLLSQIKDLLSGWKDVDSEDKEKLIETLSNINAGSPNVTVNPTVNNSTSNANPSIGSASSSTSNNRSLHNMLATKKRVD